MNILSLSPHQHLHWCVCVCVCSTCHLRTIKFPEVFVQGGGGGGGGGFCLFDLQRSEC